MIFTKKHLKLFTDYSIIYFAIAFSGIPFFDENRVARAVFLLILILVFISKQKRIEGKFILVILIFLSIEIYQIVIWGGQVFSLFTSISFLLILPYLILKIVGIRFMNIFLNIVYVYAIISLFFWTLTNFAPGFHEYTYQLAALLKPFTPHQITESFILYTYEDAKELGLYRNPGPFHEPGAFGVFIVMAIVVNYIQNQSLFNTKSIVLFVAAITTFSTATYLSLFVLLISMNLFLFKKHLLISILFLPLLIYFSINFYNSLDFLGNKITEQYEEQTETSLTTPTSGRILGARKALVSISKYPITGRGILSKTQADPTAIDAAGYGWITWISQIGLPIGLLYMYFFYKSLKNYCLIWNIDTKFALIAFIALLIVLAGQKHISTIIFFMVPLNSYLYKIYFLKESISTQDVI